MSMRVQDGHHEGGPQNPPPDDQTVGAAARKSPGAVVGPCGICGEAPVVLHGPGKLKVADTPTKVADAAPEPAAALAPDPAGTASQALACICQTEAADQSNLAWVLKHTDAKHQVAGPDGLEERRVPPRWMLAPMAPSAQSSGPAGDA